MEKKKRDNHWVIWIAIIILTVFIIYQSLDLEPRYKKPPSGLVIGVNQTNQLVDIVDYVVSGTDLGPLGVCYDYSVYYDKVFKKYWPELDVRWIRAVDICNNGTYCDSLHTYVIVNGYGAECLVDQKRYMCNILKND